MTESFPSATPQTFSLWRCVGCGAMGHEADCLGGCVFGKLVVIDAGVYAEAAEVAERAADALAATRVALVAVAAAARDERAFEAAYPELRGLAAAALAAARGTPSLAEPDAAERLETWRCATCGLAEAPQECIDVCVHPRADYVRVEDYVAVRAAARGNLRRLAAAGQVLRALATSTPRAGQWARAGAHFGAAALAAIGEG